MQQYKNGTLAEEPVTWCLDQASPVHNNRDGSRDLQVQSKQVGLEEAVEGSERQSSPEVLQ